MRGRGGVAPRISTTSLEADDFSNSYFRRSSHGGKKTFGIYIVRGWVVQGHSLIINDCWTNEKILACMENVSLTCHKTGERDLSGIRRIHCTLLKLYHYTNHFNIILCHELYLFMETISLPYSQKPEKIPFRISRIQFKLLQFVPSLKLVCQRELFLCPLWIHVGEWRYGSTYFYRRGWMEVSGRLYGSAVLSSW
jgi:hypothetical protein